MKIKLDLWYKNPSRLAHDEINESDVIEAIAMYLKSLGRIKEEENPRIEIDEIISQ